MSVNANPTIASAHLQKHIDEIEKWLKIWRIKANQSKSVHVIFTLKKGDCPPITLNGEQIPHEGTAKYLDQTKDEFVSQPHNESDENKSSSPKKTPENVILLNSLHRKEKTSLTILKQMRRKKGINIK
ncbi:unnamed protein product [Parnassius apollo]|uniref:(apollo) hypothetical protein n=1 Tax=Parnassius apollo TaxID=110799 RepID=A0A8S3X8H9_PARAO|nr:unnamed protein product [Parnassius apollo]